MWSPPDAQLEKRFDKYGMFIVCIQMTRLLGDNGKGFQ